MKILNTDSRIFLTGSAGFIGYHLASHLLDEGFAVHGYDGLTDYYDVELKEKRHAMLAKYPNFSLTVGMLEDQEVLAQAVNRCDPAVIVHLAAQAGVRYSLENPHAYVQSNVLGTLNVMEMAREQDVKHFLTASTSSIYGANTEMPYSEVHKADNQLTIYAATKKATESMTHAYSHLWNIPTTVFRFFTVYGPWGRPDMALFKFVDAILDGKAIDIYNKGDMYRDFTYVSDLVHAIRLLIDVVPQRDVSAELLLDGDSLSSVAPWRLVNIGNSDKVRLLKFVELIEKELELKAIRNYLPMQAGDAISTWADNTLLKKLTDYEPTTKVEDGVAEFVNWFRAYYGK